MSRYTKTTVYHQYAIQHIAGTYALFRSGQFIIEMPTMNEAIEWINENE